MSDQAKPSAIVAVLGWFKNALGNFETRMISTSNEGYPLTLEQGVIGGEEGVGSVGAAQDRVTGNRNVAALTDGAGVKTISAVACRLHGIMITKALTGTIAITGLLDETGTAITFTLVAGAVGFQDFGDGRCDSGVSVNKNNVADNGLITVIWYPILAG